MNAYINRADLLDALEKSAQCAAKGKIQQILSMVRIEAIRDSIRFEATDTESVYHGHRAATVEQEGSALVDVAVLLRSLRAAAGEMVRLRTTKARLLVEVGRVSFKLPSMSVDEFPSTDPPSMERCAKIDAGSLERAIRAVAFSIADDMARWGLNGAKIENRAGELWAISTDGHRLSMSPIGPAGDLELVDRALVSPTALSVIRRTLRGDEGSVRIAMADFKIHIESAQDMMSFRLIEGEFPDYRAIIPDTHETCVTASKDSMLEALKIAQATMGPQNRAVSFQCAQSFQCAETIEILARSMDSGESIQTILVETEGPAITIGFNARYLLDAIGPMDGDSVRIRMGGSLSPVMLDTGPDCREQWVVMPMRLD